MHHYFPVWFIDVATLSVQFIDVATLSVYRRTPVLASAI